MKTLKIILLGAALAACALALPSCRGCAGKTAPEETAAARQTHETNATGQPLQTGIGMAVVPAVHTGVPESIEVQISNNTETPAHFGAEFTVERLADGEWELVPGSDKFPVPMILHTLDPGASQTFTFHLRPDMAAYEKGLYRVSKNVRLDNETNHPVSAEFEIR